MEEAECPDQTCRSPEHGIGEDCLSPPAAEGLAGEVLEFDPELLGRMHILDAEQGERLAEILREGFESRAREIEQLARRDFYLDKFFRPEGER